MASAPKLRPLKTDDEIKAIPVDQPVLIELPAAVTNAEPEKRTDTPVVQQEQQADPAKALQAQLDAMRSAQEAERTRLTRERDEAREAARRANEDRAGAEKQAATSGLAQAQSDIAAAKTAFRIASEAADFAAAADAQEKIGRASAAILSYERDAAEHGLRETQAKREPPAQAQQSGDMLAAMQASPNLLPKEKDWFTAHPEALIDTRMNRRLEVAYDKAMDKGLSRGTAAYFQFIDGEMGYRQPDQQQRQDDDADLQHEEEVMGAAPVSRQNGTLNGAPARSDQIILSPEQREICANMGVSEVEYAKGLMKMRQEKKDNPEKYFIPANR